MPTRSTVRAALWIAGISACLRALPAPAQTMWTGPSFEGRLLVVASDGDMQAQAYAGDVLGPPAPDMLSIIKLNASGLPTAAGTVEVANSVIGPPASLSVSPDGHYAVVVETRGPRPVNRGDARLKDLPPGQVITVIDVSDPDRPRVVQRLTGRNNPISVSIRADGELVAVAYDTSSTDDAPLDLYRFANGQVSDPRSPVVPGFTKGDTLKSATFAPDGTLALVYATRPRLSLVHVTVSERSLNLTRWGDDLPLGHVPFEVRFTSDGRFALINDMFVPNDGNDVRGTVTSVAVAESRTADGTPRHRVVSTARTGVMPEGLAISPDERWVATTNLERTAYSAVDPHQGWFASITLLHFDRQTGQLARVGDFPFAGVIPEAAAFDNGSHYLAVTSFDHLNQPSSKGSVDFWRIAGDFQDPDRIELVPTGVSIPVARGAQSMEIIR